MVSKQKKNFDVDFDSQTQPSHKSYKQYQRRIARRRYEGLVMFISAFFVMLFIFLGLAKQLTPEIDVSIGTNETPQDVQELAKNSIDDRLKMIHLEDKGIEDEMFDTSLDEKVVLPKKQHKEETTQSENTKQNSVNIEETSKNTEKNLENLFVKDSKKEEIKAPIPTAENTKPSTSIQSAKVLVGYYTTAEQAEVAKGILIEAGLDVKPFIRNIGGAYTIQTGAFSSRETAEAAAAELLRNNFPARVFVEQ